MADATLKEAMAEIKAILRRYDIGGAVHLVSPTHSEYLYELSPSWSCITLYPDGHVRFRAKREDFASKDAQHKAVELSTHLLLQLRDLGAQEVGNMEAIVEVLLEHFDIEHEPFAGYEPHREH